jgi:hypothetical protein
LQAVLFLCTGQNLCQGNILIAHPATDLNYLSLFSRKHPNCLSHMVFF